MYDQSDVANVEQHSNLPSHMQNPANLLLCVHRLHRHTHSLVLAVAQTSLPAVLFSLLPRHYAYARLHPATNA